MSDSKSQTIDCISARDDLAQWLRPCVIISPAVDLTTAGTVGPQGRSAFLKTLKTPLAPQTFVSGFQIIKDVAVAPSEMYTPRKKGPPNICT